MFIANQESSKLSVSIKVNLNIWTQSDHIVQNKEKVQEEIASIINHLINSQDQKAKDLTVVQKK